MELERARRSTPYRELPRTRAATKFAAVPAVAVYSFKVAVISFFDNYVGRASEETPVLSGGVTYRVVHCNPG